MLAQLIPSELQQRRAARPVLSLVGDEAALHLRRAEPADAAEIHALAAEFVAQGLLLPRTLDDIYRTIRDFTVAVEDGRIVGCAALRIYSADLAEIGALAVDATRHGAGIGRRLVETLVHDARTLGLHRVLALTLQDGFFHRLGFRTVPVSQFPEKIASDCSTCARRSTCHEIAVVRDLVLDV